MLRYMLEVTQDDARYTRVTAIIGAVALIAAAGLIVIGSLA